MRGERRGGGEGEGEENQENPLKNGLKTPYMQFAQPGVRLMQEATHPPGHDAWTGVRPP